MIRPAAFVVAIAALSLAACGEKGDGTSISLNAGGTDGNVTAGVDGKTGQMSLNVPGFSGRIKLPKIKLDAGDFDMNGVHLYPGSTISGMNIDARDNDANEDTGQVKVSFDSPASPDVVRAWFAEKLTTAGDFKLQSSGTGLSGTAEDGKVFKLDLAPTGDGKSKGTLVIGS
jgi:hypothetical protein